jgi:hypothetical protein
VYAFACCAYFIINGWPLFTKDDPKAYLNNTTKHNEGYYGAYMEIAINKCLSDNPEDRLSFEVLQKEIFHHLIITLCKEKTEQADGEAVAMIVKHGCLDLLNYNDISSDKANCLHIACKFGRSSVVKVLLAKGADPNSTRLTDYTGLHVAVSDGASLSCCQLLVEAGADANKQNGHQETCLDWAIPDLQEVGEYLYSIGARCNKDTYPSKWKQ